MRRSTRNILLGLGIIALAAVAAIWFVRGPGPMSFSEGRKVTLTDYKGGDPTGVPASLAKASLVDRGKYLAQAADCVACHMSPGGREYAGGLAIRLPFGTLYSSNITPDSETGIGDYSDQDFLNALRRGVRRDGARLYPAMPFTSYSSMTDADALAIKAYLFSLPPVRAAVPASTFAFPFNQRWAMNFWTPVFNRDSRFMPDSSKDLEWNRGAYLAEALAHCGECHTPRNIAFALNNRQKFAGAAAAGWYAFNITSDKASGIGDWRDEDIVDYLSFGHATGHGTASGTMGEAVDHSFSRMVPEDIHALVAYLRTIPPIASSDSSVKSHSPAPDSPKRGGGGSDARGKMVFEGACVSCHSWTGESAVSSFATLTGATALNASGATNVAQIVISGTTRRTPEGVAMSMPAFGGAYSDDEISAVVNYVTARFGGKGSQITASDIAALRGQTSK